MTEDDRKAPLSNATVLIVEDEYYQAIEVAEAIEHSGGIVVGPYATEGEGMASLAHVAPDCALLDINTGRGPSFMLAEALIERDIPFAFLTGYDTASIPKRFEQVRRIEKPSDVRAMVDVLAALRSA